MKYLQILFYSADKRTSGFTVIKSISLLGFFFHQIQTCSVSGHMMQNRNIRDISKAFRIQRKNTSISIFKILRFLFFSYICVFACMWVCACECWHLQKAGEDVESPRNGSCELSNMGVLTWTWIHCKCSVCSLPLDHLTNQALWLILKYWIVYLYWKGLPMQTWFYKVNEVHST